MKVICIERVRGFGHHFAPGEIYNCRYNISYGELLSEIRVVSTPFSVTFSDKNFQFLDVYLDVRIKNLIET